MNINMIVNVYELVKKEEIVDVKHLLFDFCSLFG